MRLRIISHPALSNRFSNTNPELWQVPQLYSRILFIFRSSGVSSGKLANHSASESCLHASWYGLSAKSCWLFLPEESVRSARVSSKPTACAQIRYWPSGSGGKLYSPLWFVYTDVVMVEPWALAETGTPSSGFPSEDLTVPVSPMLGGDAVCAAENPTYSNAASRLRI